MFPTSAFQMESRFQIATKTTTSRTYANLDGVRRIDLVKVENA